VEGLNAYLARPERGSRGGMLLLPSAYGVNAGLRRCADDIAAAGVTALVCAWLPPPRDWPGFLAVWLIGSAWSGAYLAASWPLGEYPRGWIAAVIFGSYGAVCLVAIGWPEPPERAEPPREN
jgi:hypothetical protein